MREILFRGKRKDDGEWTQGYLFRIWEEAYICWGTVNGVPDMQEVDPETVCQYTGLTDKNDRKIFEGDIVKIPYERLEDSICKVTFNHGMFIGELVDGCEDSIIGRKDIEIISNIFDNPELLKGDEK